MLQEQKYAWFNTLYWGGFLVFSLVFFVFKDPLACWRDETVRHLFAVLLAVGIIADLAFRVIPKRKRKQRKVMLDERDIMILGKSHQAALIVVNIYFVICCVIITKMYWDPGVLPVIYVYIMVFYSWILMYLVYSVATLINYRLRESKE